MSALLISFLILIIIIEFQNKLKPNSPLSLNAKDLLIKKSSTNINISFLVEIINSHKRMEVMVPSFTAEALILGSNNQSNNQSNIQIKTNITTEHPEENNRKDNYWPAYIVKSRKKTKVRIGIIIENKTETIKSFQNLEDLWVNIHWSNYGPFGLIKRKQGVVIPITRPSKINKKQLAFIDGIDFSLLPIKTHMLGVFDDLSDVIKEYALDLIEPEDILTIGETPLAIIQGRYIDPSSLNPNWFTFLLCKPFHPTSSLATACGMETLINIVGPSRVLLAWVIGICLKLIGIKGFFYRLAGRQARLIDDITGTTPPYDKSIVLGPKSPKEVCEVISKQYGIKVAIVDVNDLGRVKVLATSQNCRVNLLLKALQSNPAGNADQKTPLVLVRPSS